MALYAGVDIHRVNQAWEHSLDMAAIFKMKNPVAHDRCMADRMETPTRGMLAVLRRRRKMIERMRATGEMLGEEAERELTFDFELALRKQTDRRLAALGG